MYLMRDNRDGKQVVIGAIMQHIEQAGVHSGDSACSLPPYSLDARVQDEMREQVRQMALELEVLKKASGLYRQRKGGSW